MRVLFILVILIFLFLILLKMAIFFEDNHFIDDPLFVVFVEPYFDDMGFTKERLSMILDDLYK